MTLMPPLLLENEKSAGRSVFESATSSLSQGFLGAALLSAVELILTGTDGVATACAAAAAAGEGLCMRQWILNQFERRPYLQKQ